MTHKDSITHENCIMTYENLACHGELCRTMAGGNYQCRNPRTPVKTIGIPSSFAFAITSSSRIDPPG